MKQRVLFVTQTLGDKAACGIGLIGNLIGNTLISHPEYEFYVLYTDGWSDIMAAYNSWQPNAIIYNYAPGTTPWMDLPYPRNEITVPQVRIMHDMYQVINLLLVFKVLDHHIKVLLVLLVRFKKNLMKLFYVCTFHLDITKTLFTALLAAMPMLVYRK